MKAKRRIRLLLAKIGLDGHDRGVKVLARSFREAGFEVIYTGLWQTCESTMYAAMQEDVDVVGVSLLSAAHLTIVPELVALRRRLEIEHVPIVLGGIIPESDHEKVRQMGVSAVFNPGSSIAEIVERIQELADDRTDRPLSELFKRYREGQPQALARLISRLQSGESLDESDWPEGHARVIGVTGAPGVGKSSFIGKLGAELRKRSVKVGVVAVDPTSPLTGGALLGDRLRMMRGEPDEGFFVRSLASADEQGGLAPNCAPIVRLINGFGFDVVFVETVGAGQSDVRIRSLVDDVLLLLMPEAGDAIQFSKAGIIEVATHFVINKADLPGAEATEAQLRGAIGPDRPVWTVSSISSKGMAEVADWVVSVATVKS